MEQLEVPSRVSTPSMGCGQHVASNGRQDEEEEERTREKERYRRKRARLTKKTVLHHSLGTVSGRLHYLVECQTAQKELVSSPIPKLRNPVRIPSSVPGLRPQTVTA